MRQFRFLILLLVCLVLVLPAKADFSETYASISDAYRQGGTVHVTISDVKADLHRSDAALQMLNGILSPLRLELTASKVQAGLTFQSGNNKILSLAESDEIAVDQTALVKAQYEALAPELYALLETYGTAKEAQKSLTVGGVVPSRKQIVYTVKQEDAQAMLPELHALIDEPVRLLLSDSELLEPVQAYLASLDFSGSLTMRRYQTKDGNDLGVQIKCKVSSGSSDKRNVTIICAFSDKASTISAACPAVKGNNNLNFELTQSVTEKKKANEWAFEYTLKRTNESVKRSTSVKGSLKNTLSSGEKWTGSISLTDTQGGVSDVYTLTPELYAEDGALLGTWKLKYVSAKQTLWTLNGSVKMEKASDDAVFPEGSAEDAALDLAKWLSQMLDNMSPEDRYLLTHALRTDAWMNSPVVPVPDDSVFEKTDDICVPDEND